jgi:serine/threonine protein kinase
MRIFVETSMRQFLYVSAATSFGLVLESPKTKYKAIHDLSSGGHGIIYDALDISTGSPVVIKCSKTTSSVSQYEQEYEILSRLESEDWAPNPIEFFLTKQGRPCIVQEKLGFDLQTIRDKVIRQGALLGEETLGSLGVLMVDIIQSLHEKYKYSHRDLHPGNWMVASNQIPLSPQLKLIDFADATPHFAPNAMEDLREVTMTVRFMFDGDYNFYAWKRSAFDKAISCRRIPVRLCNALELANQPSFHSDDLRKIFMEMITRNGKLYSGRILWEGPFETPSFYKTPFAYTVKRDISGTPDPDGEQNVSRKPSSGWFHLLTLTSILIVIYL